MAPESYKKTKVRLNGERITVGELERLMRTMDSEQKLDSILMSQARCNEQIKGLGAWVGFLKAGYLALASAVLGIVAHLAGFTI